MSTDRDSDEELAPEHLARISHARQSVLKTDSMIHSAIDLLQVMVIEMSSIENLVREGHDTNKEEVVILIAKIQEEIRMEGDLLRMTRKQLGIKPQDRERVAVRTFRDYLTTTKSAPSITSSSHTGGGGILQATSSSEETLQSTGKGLAKALEKDGPSGSPNGD